LLDVDAPKIASPLFEVDFIATPRLLDARTPVPATLVPRSAIPEAVLFQLAQGVVPVVAQVIDVRTASSAAAAPAGWVATRNATLPTPRIAIPANVRRAHEPAPSFNGLMMLEFFRFIRHPRHPPSPRFGLNLQPRRLRDCADRPVERIGRFRNVPSVA